MHTASRQKKTWQSDTQDETTCHGKHPLESRSSSDAIKKLVLILRLRIKQSRKLGRGCRIPVDKELKNDTPSKRKTSKPLSLTHTKSTNQHFGAEDQTDTEAGRV